eukprot:3940313-Rhodomonas_salina.3
MLCAVRYGDTECGYDHAVRCTETGHLGTTMLGIVRHRAVLRYGMWVLPGAALQRLDGQDGQDLGVKGRALRNQTPKTSKFELHKLYAIVPCELLYSRKWSGTSASHPALTRYFKTCLQRA